MAPIVSCESRLGAWVLAACRPEPGRDRAQTRTFCRTLITTFANALMSTDADALCGQRSDERVNRLYGYRRRTPNRGGRHWFQQGQGR